MRLDQRFMDSTVVFLYASLDHDQEVWRRFVQEYDFQGVHTRRLSPTGSRIFSRGTTAGETMLDLIIDRFPRHHDQSIRVLVKHSSPVLVHQGRQILQREGDVEGIELIERAQRLRGTMLQDQHDEVISKVERDVSGL